jgi:Domain of unknown function (DUF4386)
MIGLTKEASPRFKARITGIVYLLYFLMAIFAEFLNGRGLVVYSNAANLVAYTFYLVLTLLFFFMFRPVSRYISVIAALFGFAGCAIGALGLFYPPASNINPLVFFGPYCLMIGYLIFRSFFLPRILGVLMVLAGVGWLVFLSPPANYLSSCIEILGIVAEVSLMLWLIVMGVNNQRWKEQAGATAERA